MNTNRSPWLAQLRRNRPVTPLVQNTHTEIAIIGGGIAGVTTAYFTLRYTDHSVLLIEADKVAHGASGHNGGQAISEFEPHLSDLISQYGKDMTLAGERALDSSWELLQEIYRGAHLQTPLDIVTGYDGYQDIDSVLVHLENTSYRQQAQMGKAEEFLVAEHITHLIPEKYKPFYTVVPHQSILSALETINPRYIAVINEKIGCLNSASFCEELMTFMLHTYADRCRVAEQSPVQAIRLQSDTGDIRVGHHTVNAKKIVLCTNGYTGFTLTSDGHPIPHRVQGLVGYMAAYTEENTKSPAALSYHPPKKRKAENPISAEPYIYVTRRPYELEDHRNKNLITIGGPDHVLPRDTRYERDHPYPDHASTMIDDFLITTYGIRPDKNPSTYYQWHGIMGYTDNGIRCIGPEPRNPILLYNLGCNGVGLLPSLYGGKKISQFLNNESLPPSLFDPSPRTVVQ